MALLKSRPTAALREKNMSNIRTILLATSALGLSAPAFAQTPLTHHQ